MRTVAPGRNPVPVSDRIVTGQPRLPEVGFLAVRVGALLVTVNRFWPTPVSDEGFVTVTFRRPAFAPARSKVQVIRWGILQQHCQQGYQGRDLH